MRADERGLSAHAGGHVEKKQYVQIGINHANGIIHTYWHRPKAREGALERTRPACGMGSSLAACAS